MGRCVQKLIEAGAAENSDPFLENIVFDEHNREVDYTDKSMADGTEHNLDEYIQVISSSSNSDDDSTTAVQTEKFGVVVNEDKLKGFFSLIYDDHY